ncbi:MAG: NAD(P)/FAD-dependent oxidoreductase [Candidatus Thorarchaeota archaeon]
MTLKKCDLIVLGAGTAGCLAAYGAAKEGLSKVVLLDRKPKEMIGKKICGDGIGLKHLELLESLGFPIKENNIIANLIKTAHLVSPDKEKDYKIPTQNQLAIIERHKFGQVILDEALKAGVSLNDEIIFNDFERKNNNIVINTSSKNGEVIKYEAPLLVDASGINSKIRENFNEFGTDAIVQDDEQYYCYREICQVEELPEYYQDSAVFEFGYETTRGGYIWFFSRGNNSLNMGSGIPKSWIKELSPKDVYQKEIAPRFKIKQIDDFGGGFVPTRHPIPTHVKDNIILIGDAGAIVNPLHGGGLSASLASRYIAGKIAAKYVPAERVKEEDLWTFNLQINERYGKRYSLLDLYRILLQNIPDKELNHAFIEEYLPLGMIFYAREYDLLLNLSRQLSEVWQTIPNERFELLPDCIEKINNLTSKYPQSSEDLPRWAAEYNKTYKDYQAKIEIR